MIDSFMEFAHVDEEDFLNFDFSELEAEEIEEIFSEVIGLNPENVDEDGNEFLTNEKAEEILAHINIRRFAAID